MLASVVQDSASSFTASSEHGEVRTIAIAIVTTSRSLEALLDVESCEADSDFRVEQSLFHDCGVVEADHGETTMFWES